MFPSTKLFTSYVSLIETNTPELHNTVLVAIAVAVVAGSDLTLYRASVTEHYTVFQNMYSDTAHRLAVHVLQERDCLLENIFLLKTAPHLSHTGQYFQFKLFYNKMQGKDIFITKAILNIMQV
jgi:hypothetical protein